MKEIWVCGYPSFVGGADTELDHNIDLLLSFDIEVNLVPCFGFDLKMKKLCDDRGCKTHTYVPGIFKDKIVMSYCNGEFLKLLPEIMEYRPAAIVWFNCMTWTFENEVIAHKNKWIDYFGFVSKYQQSILQPKLEAAGGAINVFEDYMPYFNLTNNSQGLTFTYEPPKNWFSMGRCSRDDGNKFSSDMWNIFYKVCSPRPTKTFVLGFGENALKKCGNAPNGLDWQTWTNGAIPVKELYQKLHCLIHKTGGSRESYCRIVPECYASGVPVIVEDDYAFPYLVLDGITGFRCKSSDEMSYCASRLAFDERLRRQIIANAQKFLENEIANRDKCFKPWKKLLGV